jgi:ABC-2 type transport system ATP-binding protein
MSYAIETSGLTKRYGDVLAVEELSLAVPAGCLFGFLGPNGSGKSTTIGCLTGLLDPTAGEIRLLGEPLTPFSTSIKRRIGVMPETLGLSTPSAPTNFLAFQRPHVRAFGEDAPPRHRGLLESQAPTGEVKTALQFRHRHAASACLRRRRDP